MNTCPNLNIYVWLLFYFFAKTNILCNIILLLNLSLLIHVIQVFFFYYDPVIVFWILYDRPISLTLYRHKLKKKHLFIHACVHQVKTDRNRSWCMILTFMTLISIFIHFFLYKSDSKSHIVLLGTHTYT